MKHKTLTALFCYLAAALCFAEILRGEQPPASAPKPGAPITSTGTIPPTLTAEQKLAVREAQVEVLALQVQAQQIQSAIEKAQGKLKLAVAAAEKVCGGEVANDLTCAAKHSEKP